MATTVACVEPETAPNMVQAAAVEIRGEGLLCAVEFAAEPAERRFFNPAGKVGPAIAAALLEDGVIGRAMPQGDILGLAPPPCLDRTETDIIVTSLCRAVERTLG